MSESIRIHALCNGKVALQVQDGQLAIPDWMHQGRHDPRWREWLPIHSWVVEHPEGLIVIDCGETMRAFEPDYFDRDLFTRFIYEKMFHFSLEPEDEIGPQMEALGLSPADVRTVLLTHLHADHVDGMVYFPHAEFLVSAREYHEALRRPTGALPNRWPEWFKPRLIEHETQPFGPFTHSHTVTRAGDLHLIPTPGHTRGHQSAVLECDGRLIFFAGDTSFSERQMLEADSIGFNLDARETVATQRKIRQLAAQRPMVYLPSHDPDSAERLKHLQIVAIPDEHSVQDQALTR